MRLQIRTWKEMPREEQLRVLRRSETDIEEVTASVQAILKRVREEGDSALLDFSRTFDHVELAPDQLRVSKEEIEEAESLLEPELVRALHHAIENVKKFHQTQKPEAMSIKEIEPGLFAGERATPIDSVALYVPRGRGSFPSMLYMMAVPAVIAEVPRIVMVTPPGSDGSIDAACLYTARILGIKEIYRIGGAHAIGAMTWGTDSIRPVDKIIGPGSMYVTAAKRILYGTVDVGLPAGPSESILIADKDADPELAAKDLLVEAEHGSDSCAILLTPERGLAEAVLSILNEKISSLPEPRRGFVSDVLGSGYGGIILTDSMEEALEISNSFAPEHLELLVKEPFALLGKIRHAGEILLGENMPFSCANYITGANAILPTGGKARTFSAVSVRDFIKYSSVVWATREGYHTIAGDTECLARYEGFLTHADAVTRRWG
jgi:histidinol dehydrogenase